MIDCVVKAYLCHETKPDVWGQVQLVGLELLTRRDLERYRELLPNKEDCPGEWDADLDDPGSMWPYWLGSAIMRSSGQH